MPACGTFDYVAVVPEGGVADGISATLRVPVTLTGDRLWDDRLVGYRPRIEVTAQEFALVATQPEHSRLARASLEVAPGLSELLQPGDQLNVLRSPSADVAVSVLRGDRLVVAFGAASLVPLGSELKVHATLEGARIFVGTDSCALATGESATLGGYDLVVWYGHSEPGARPPGHAECVSVGLGATSAGRIARTCVSPRWSQHLDPLILVRFGS